MSFKKSNLESQVPYMPKEVKRCKRCGWEPLIKGLSEQEELKKEEFGL